MAGGPRMTLTGTVRLSFLCLSHSSSRLAQACSHVSGTSCISGFLASAQSYLLLSHSPKHITWPSPESM